MASAPISTIRARLLAWADEVFGMDLRAIALFRIGLGLILLLDLVDRSQDLIAHYTDLGALPRAVVPSAQGRLSLHMMSGEGWFQAALLAAAGLASLGLLFGFHTRLMLVAAWVLNFSIQTRNPMVLYGGDIVLRVLLFWALFLPLGELWSLDARRRRPRGARALHMGTAAFVVQIALIYITTAVLKTGDDWRNGTAVWYTLQIDHFTSPFGRQFLAFPGLLEVLTHAVFWFETVGPWLLLVPRWWVRVPVVLGFIGMHLSFEVFMEIGLFPWISALGWIPLLPRQAWDRLRLPTLEGGTLGASRLTQGVAVVALAYVTWWNLGSMSPKQFGVTGHWRTPARVLRIDQYWDMFAPEPLKDDGWFIVAGEREDGQLDDVLHGGPVTWAKPYDVANLYRNERWRKYMRNLWNRKYARLRDPYLHWRCREWNAHAADHARLVRVSLYYMREDSPPPGQTATSRKILLRTIDCE